MADVLLNEKSMGGVGVRRGGKRWWLGGGQGSGGRWGGGGGSRSLRCGEGQNATKGGAKASRASEEEEAEEEAENAGVNQSPRHWACFLQSSLDVGKVAI